MTTDPLTGFSFPTTAYSSVTGIACCAKHGAYKPWHVETKLHMALWSNCPHCAQEQGGEARLSLCYGFGDCPCSDCEPEVEQEDMEE